MFKPWSKRYFVAEGHYVKYYMDEKHLKMGRAEDIMASYDIAGATCQMKKGAEFELILIDGSKVSVEPSAGVGGGLGERAGSLPVPTLTCSHPTPSRR